MKPYGISMENNLQLPFGSSLALWAASPSSHLPFLLPVFPLLPKWTTYFWNAVFEAASEEIQTKTCSTYNSNVQEKYYMHAKVLYGNLSPSNGSCFFPRNSLIPVKCLISLFLLYVSALCLCPQALKKTCKISPKIVKYIR